MPNAKMNLYDALSILQKRYEREYSNYINVDVSYGKEFNYGSYSSWSDNYYIYYTLCLNISFSKKVGDTIINYNIKKSKKELKSDLLDELKVLFSDDNYDISKIILPTCGIDKIDYNEEIKILFTEKSNNKVLKKK